MDGISPVSLKPVHDERGDLIAVENKRDVPFDIDPALNIWPRSSVIILIPIDLNHAIQEAPFTRIFYPEAPLSGCVDRSAQDKR